MDRLLDIGWVQVDPETSRDLPPADRYVGYLYCMTLENGNTKIGSTQAPARRIPEHIRNNRLFSGQPIGSIYMSTPHINFRENENFVCRKFGGGSARSELLTASEEDIAEVLLALEYDTGIAQIHYKTESSRELAKAFLLHGESTVLDSRVIATCIGVKHKNLIELVHKYRDSLERLGRVNIVKLYSDDSYQLAAFLSQPQVQMLLCFVRTSPAAVEFITEAYTALAAR